jgi:hypothetical protein
MGGGGGFLQANPLLQAGAGKIIYNQIAKYAEPIAKKAAMVTIAKNAIMQELQSTGMASGTFTFSSGNSWAEAAKDDKKLADAQKKLVTALTEGQKWSNVTVGTTTVSISYAVDGGALTPRSGNVALKYKYVTTFNGTNAQGQAVSTSPTVLGVFAIQFSDARIQNMTLKEP